MSRELLEVIETIYSLDLDSHTWLAELADRATATFPGCAGGFAYSLSSLLAHPMPLEVAGTPGLLDVPRAAHEAIRQDELRAVYGDRPTSGPARSYFASVGRPFPEALERMWRGLEVADFFAVTAPQPTRASVAFGLALDPAVYPSVERHDWRPLTDSWSAVALHLDQAASLRESLEAGRAVVDGYVDEHGRGELSDEAAPWRHQIAAIALAQERIRGALGDGSEQALWQWAGLLGGLWSVVRCRARGGRVEYLAVRNPTNVLRKLSRFERHVIELAAAGDHNRRIADSLGAHESSVSRALRYGLRKLGLRSRTDLILLRAALIA